MGGAIYGTYRLLESKIPHWSRETFATIDELEALSSHMVGKRPPKASRVLILKASNFNKFSAGFLAVLTAHIRIIKNPYENPQT